ncbi:hypothetical protein FS842_009102 [Serendipita sp. 407]|nr:hypothetical protein FRC18_010859 [Serendipita sp. 400]KAG9052885.1 hypothetical protein FS842_009102 [Serendipita sp. 407]
MRPRTSSIPSLADAEYAFHSARKQPLRRILAYTVLTTFLAVFLILGFAGSYPKDWASLELGGFRGFPDFEHIRGDGVRTITAEQLKESRRKRYVVVGDIHGMHQSFEKLMSTVSYSESSDYLIHVGDLVAKGPSSAKVVHDLSHQNVTGVRGNHDQKVIEWKGWIDWVESYNGGSEWLKDMESKTESELEELKKNTKKRKWKIPEGWKFGGEHYWIARRLTSHEARYIMNLPLIIHVPSYHLFFVHAGLLPLNPTIPLNSKHQPLSHVPGSLRKRALVKHYNNHHGRALDAKVDDGQAEVDKHGHRKPKDERDLRTLQEQLLLEAIPQNTVPFNLLNMRSVEHNAPVKSSNKGRPWSDVWNTVVSKCKGFPKDAVRLSLSGEGLPPIKGDDGKKRNMTWWESLVEDGGEIIDWDPEEEEEPDYTWSRIPKKLPCNPSTVIYGHAAGRGLDLKRWTLGLDSGCVYGRRMTALVFSEDEKELATLDALGVSSPGTPSNTDSEPEVQVTKIDLGDTLDNGKHLHARLASVRCPDVGA